MWVIKKISKLFPFLKEVVRFTYSYYYLRKNINYNNDMGLYFKGPKVMSSSQFEKNELMLFNTIIPKIDCFINIGANVGYYALFALKASKEVIAFEPDPLNFKILLQNVSKNFPDSNYHLFNSCLGSLNCISSFYGSGLSGSLKKDWNNQSFSSQVSVNKLDDYSKLLNIKKRYYILIDVEGSEFDVLLGSTELFKFDCIFLVEITLLENWTNGKNINFLKTFELFFKHGYSAYNPNEANKKIPHNELINIYNKSSNHLQTYNYLFMRENDNIDLKR
ncbi:FkbM family methyltransferase [Methylophilaceae bacterium]|nr:FkbM family methyltransferase [Methylophilaceae bacterium]